MNEAAEAAWLSGWAWSSGPLHRAFLQDWSFDCSAIVAFTVHVHRECQTPITIHKVWYPFYTFGCGCKCFRSIDVEYQYEIEIVAWQTTSLRSLQSKQAELSWICWILTHSVTTIQVYWSLATSSDFVASLCWSHCGMFLYQFAPCPWILSLVMRIEHFAPLKV